MIACTRELVECESPTGHAAGVKEFVELFTGQVSDIARVRKYLGGHVRCEFALPGSEMERLFYAFSTLHCLSVSMQNGGAGTGTVIRADTVRRLASEAGFEHVEVLEVEHPQFRLYRLS